MFYKHLGNLLGVLLGLGLVLLPFAHATVAHATTDKIWFVSIGTGGSTGVYYPVGRALARILNAHKDMYNIRATAEATGASIYNIKAIMAGELEFGFAQADCQYQAYNGVGDWAGEKQTELRAVFALAPEMVTLVVADDSGIHSLADVKGKALNIGNPGSGIRQNSIAVLKAAGFDFQKDLNTVGIKAADAPRQVQDNRLEGFFYTVGHPNSNILEATSGPRKVRIVPIPDLMTLPQHYPFYTIAHIDMANYPGAVNATEGMVPTVAMPSTFVTSAHVPDELVYNLVKAVFENLDEFKSTHPALHSITPKSMLEGHSAPLHPGAEKYYKEKKLIQ